MLESPGRFRIRHHFSGDTPTKTTGFILIVERKTFSPATLIFRRRRTALNFQDLEISFSLIDRGV